VTEAVPQGPLLARVSEAATALAISEDQVQKYMKDGKLPRVRLGKSVRTTWAAIRALAEHGEAVA
jgi:excisionase family DNA binding protein